jgi:hypothetical protein
VLEGIEVYYQNVRGLNSKITDFRTSVSAAPFDIVALTETWLYNDVNNSELFGSDYVIFRHDRERTLNCSRGGRVLLAVKTKFKSKFVDIKLPDADSPRPIDLVCVKITSGFSVFYIFVVTLGFLPNIPLQESLVAYKIPSFASAKTSARATPSRIFHLIRRIFTHVFFLF